MKTEFTHQCDRAMTQLLRSHPFYARLALRLKIVANARIRTAMTDGEMLEINPAYLATLTEPQRVGLIAHEVYHCAAGHIWRRGNRDWQRWNVACDHTANLSLKDDGIELFPGALCDESYRGQSEEAIYRGLPKPTEDQGDDSGDEGSEGAENDDSASDDAGNGASGDDTAEDALSGPEHDNDPSLGGGMRDPRPGNSGQQTDTTELAQQWEIAVEQAAAQARGMGFGTAGSKQLAKDNRVARPDWRDLVRQFMTAQQPSDYSWRKLNRRFLPLGAVLPGMSGEAMGPVVVIMDVSGSCWGEETLAAFAVNFNAILDDIRPERVTVVQCDTSVTDVREYEPDDYPVLLEATGGGGTDMTPAFEYIETEDIQPACVIVLTDLEMGFPDEPDYPVLWAVAGNETAKAPWGETVVID